MMEYVPSEEEREILHQHLMDLFSKQGDEPFISNAILEPIPSHFPFELNHTGEGAYRIAEYLLNFIGLSHITPEILVYKGESDDHIAATVQYTHESKTAQIQVNSNSLSDLSYLAAVIAHEITHIYRFYHGLDVENEEQEELLTDLTAVFLGFGVLLAKASYQSYSSGDFYQHSWGVSTLGYLNPQALCYVLAFQCYLRGADSFSEIPFRKLLGPNQRTFLKASFSHFVEGAIESSLYDRAQTLFPTPMPFKPSAEMHILFDESVQNITEPESPLLRTVSKLSDKNRLYVKSILILLFFGCSLLWLCLLLTIDNLRIQTMIFLFPAIVGIAIALIRKQKKESEYFKKITSAQFENSHEVTVDPENGMYLWSITTAVIGGIIGCYLFNKNQTIAGFVTVVVFPILGTIYGIRSWYFTCCTDSCNSKIKQNQSICPGCGGKVSFVRVYTDGYVEYQPIEEYVLQKFKK